MLRPTCHFNRSSALRGGGRGCPCSAPAALPQRALPAPTRSPRRQLYDLLAHPAVGRRRLPVLLACNKADMGERAHTVDFIRKRLEKEIDQVGGRD